ncbi:MAG: TetR/AcrR family transcriptional regulator [Bacillota bacterium]
MPPKRKYSKEQIVKKAFEIAKKEGIDSITIRKVAAKLNSSVAPIYVNFDNVDELIQAVIEKTFKLGEKLIYEQKTGEPFKDIGLASLKFAREYPVLFWDLLKNQGKYMNDYDNSMGNMIIEQMKEDNNLKEFSDEILREILLKMRVIQTGISVMVSSGLLPKEFDQKKEEELLDSLASDIIYAAENR